MYRLYGKPRKSGVYFHFAHLDGDLEDVPGRGASAYEDSYIGFIYAGQTQEAGRIRIVTAEIRPEYCQLAL